MSAIMHRFLRLSAFLAGLLVGGVAVLFAFDNPARIALAVGPWQVTGIPLWMVGIAPLVAGIAAGYLYHFPARLHHFNEHMRHRGLVHDLRKENQELSRSLDRLLAMPNDDTPAIAAAAAARDITPAEGPAESLVTSPGAGAPALAETVLVAVPPAGEHSGNGHSRRRPERAPAVRPEVMQEAIASAAAAMPAERPRRSPRPGRAPRPQPPHEDA